MPPCRGLLFSQMEPPTGWERDFHRWYETDHIPARMRLPGFSGATRWVSITGHPAFLAVYELGSLGVLDTPEYVSLKTEPNDETERMLGNALGFTRYICEEVSCAGRPAESAEYLSVVAFAVPPADEAEFDDWYETEHAPQLLESDDWLCVRRLRVLSGEGPPWTHLALHMLRTMEVSWGPSHARARSGPKRAALAERPWFPEAGRWLYRLLTRHDSA